MPGTLCSTWCSHFAHAPERSRRWSKLAQPRVERGSLSRALGPVKPQVVESVSSCLASHRACSRAFETEDSKIEARFREHPHAEVILSLTGSAGPDPPIGSRRVLS